MPRTTRPKAAADRKNKEQGLQRPVSSRSILERMRKRAPVRAPFSVCASGFAQTSPDGECPPPAPPRLREGEFKHLFSPAAASPKLLRCCRWYRASAPPGGRGGRPGTLPARHIRLRT